MQSIDDSVMMTEPQPIRLPRKLSPTLVQISLECNGSTPGVLQAFLFAFFKARYGWTPLPAGVNLLTAHYVGDSPFFRRHINHATLIHFVGYNTVKVMVDRVTVSEDGSTILATADGEPNDIWPALDVLWNNAWINARVALQLPFPQSRAPSARMVASGRHPGTSPPLNDGCLWNNLGMASPTQVTSMQHPQPIHGSLCI
jgi:hypothetical protein